MAEGRRIGQEGSRWFNAIPSGEEVAKWFKENVAIHDGLAPDDYVQGITLIPNTDKAKAVVGWDQNDNPVIEQTENLVYTPYAKVETRIKYFHDLMAHKQDDWLGVIEPVPPEDQNPKIPPGFFPFAIERMDNGRPVVVRFIACSMKVTVFERGDVEWKEIRNVRTGEVERVRVGKTIIDAAPGTKMVPLNTRYSVDESCLMKAETGAIGRALGMAGMLVIPGTGVATAEDMQEALGERRAEGVAPEQSPPPPAAAEASADPQASATERETLQDLRQQAMAIITLLKDEFPDTFAEFRAWAQERGIGEVGTVEDPRVLQGMIRKADRELTNERGKAAKAAEAEGGEPEEPPLAESS